MKKAASLESYAYKLPPNRQLLAAKLLDKAWFKNSTLRIQKSILSLPHAFEGFVYDMCLRNDRIGDLDIISLEKLVKGDYLITPVFKVYSHSTKTIFSYEFVSWRTGSFPGLKGTLFIEKDDKIKYFITIETDKFPIGSHSYNSLGGLIQFSGDRFFNLSENIEDKLKSQLGIKDFKIKHFYDLGKIQVDNGLTSNNPSIFAATIEEANIQNLHKLLTNSSTTEPGDYKINIVPIEQLEMYISKVDDSFFLAVIARLLARKIIKL